MQAYHVNSTKPYRYKNTDKPYKIDDFDLLCTVTSALSWRKNGGRITMLTDGFGLEYYKSLGICSVWDEVTDAIDLDLEGINPVMFWAAGKLLMWRDIKTPAVIIDTDFICWEMPDFSGNSEKIICAHYEDIRDFVYPPQKYFCMNNYSFNPSWKWDKLPLNTAFLYIPDEGFAKYYAAQAAGFMKSAQNTGDTLRYMVFAEQRLLAMAADMLGFETQPLLDKTNLLNQDKYTHLWGAKQGLRDNAELRTEFCGKCMDIIHDKFPDYYEIVKNAL